MMPPLWSTRLYGNYGMTHVPDKTSRPARDATCLPGAIATVVIATAKQEACILDDMVVRKVAADDPVYQLLLAKVLASN